MVKRTVFVSGATGYIGQALIRLLLERGHQVLALARPGSEQKVPPGATTITGNALDPQSFSSRVPPADTLVHLVGVPSPNPLKKDLFRKIDLTSLGASLDAAKLAGVRHMVYVSVAQPAPIMKSYVQARAEGEAMIRKSPMTATILRPWYVLGPGHRWPYLLLPLYWIFERVPSTRESALRLGLVHLSQIVKVLVWSVENPSDEIRIVDVKMMRKLG